MSGRARPCSSSGSDLSLLEALAVLVAGAAAGTINGVIGSGTLLTFPVLLALGYPPLVANTTNTVGLAPGAFSAAIAQRADLRGHGRRTRQLVLAATAGSTTGAVLLLVLPSAVFDAVVPALIALALVLVVLQPRLSRAIKARRDPARAPGSGPGLLAALVGTGTYGGYFGAGQGIMMFAALATALPDDLPRVNATRNLLAGVNNGVAALVFLAVADVRLGVALLLAVGSVGGGLLGARIARRLSAPVLRAVVVVVGLLAIAQLLLR